jgi:hypothetical protein
MAHIGAAKGQEPGHRRDYGDDDEGDKPAAHNFSLNFGRSGSADALGFAAKPV